MVGNFAVAIAASNDHKSSKNLKKIQSQMVGPPFCFWQAGAVGLHPHAKNVLRQIQQS
jgi:hypothetical protein